ncbi:MAG TPA: serine/threonine-protein kinase [Cellulomonas sp.]|uniref:serine/threonine-protein kinase n=1 Tax=Cellulomonas sp. TaxID=40001 RepID=UPI002E36DA6C|nr:serine/threonine-protein kinase [Cellulomonas sp.]HEX5332080.1 serine/threonine-protein kinase [Cellulomonas sp.]
MERIGLEPGSEIGGYTIVAPLGSGGMGTVYRALDGGGSPVALKLLHPHVGADPVARDRLRREVLALQRLHHPGVAAVLDAEADSTEAFLVTELVAGDDLEDVVRRHGPLDTRELHELAAGLYSALTAVHEAGVVHRDLKPANVLVTDSGPVLIDFGIAQAADDARVTTTGLVVGTPGYLAPELLDDAEPTAHTDWWGWAALLAFAATGRAPFGLRPLEQVLARARAGQPDLEGLGPITTRALRGALAPAPRDRLLPPEVVAALADAARYGDEPLDDDAAQDSVGTTVLGGGAGAATTVLGGATAAALIANDGATRAFVAGAAGDDVDDGSDGWIADELEPDDSEVDGTGYVRPRARRRWGTLLSLALVAVAAAALYPGYTLIVVGVLILLVRTVGRTVESMHARRERVGVRRSDPVRAVVLTPWHLVRSVLGLVPSIVVGASLVVIVLGVLWWMLGSGYWVLAGSTSGRQPEGWQASAVVAGAFLLGLVATWWGPLAAMTRIGARRVLAVVAPGRAGALVVVLLALAGTAVLLSQVVHGTPIVWDPLPEPILP